MPEGRSVRLDVNRRLLMEILPRVALGVIILGGAIRAISGLCWPSASICAVDCISAARIYLLRAHLKNRRGKCPLVAGTLVLGLITVVRRTGCAALARLALSPRLTVDAFPRAGATPAPCRTLVIERMLYAMLCGVWPYRFRGFGWLWGCPSKITVIVRRSMQQ